MADKLATNLNGAYYGPAIPPAEPPRNYRRHRGRSCLCCILSLFTTIVALAVIAGVIFWIVVQPRAFKFYVTAAELTQFDYDSNNNTLNYNMALNFSARNPNKKLSIYYDYVEANTFYQGKLFNTTDVITFRNSFRQYKKTSSPMSAVFSGQQKTFFENNDQIAKFNEDKNNNKAFDIYVKLYFRIRFRLGDTILRTMKPKAKCHIRVPLSSNGTMTFFVNTNCDAHF